MDRIRRTQTPAVEAHTKSPEAELGDNSTGLSDSRTSRSPITPPMLPPNPSKAQALWRGLKVRQNTVLPRELELKLREVLPSIGIPANHAHDLARILAREILNSPDTASYAGHGKRLITGQEWHAFFREIGIKPEYITTPANVWISRSGNDLEIEIMGKEIASGTSKTVSGSQIIKLQLTNLKERTTSAPAVVASFHESNQTSVTFGADRVRQNFSPEEIRKNRFAGLLTHTDRINLKTKRVEARDERYLGDLREHLMKLSEPAIEHVLSQAAESVSALHSKDLIHSDVKSENILLGNEPTIPTGYLADFDGVRLLGERIKTLSEGRADNIAETLGIATPFTDIYALAHETKRSFGFGTTNPYHEEVDALEQADLKTVKWLRDPNYPETLKALKNGTREKRKAAFQDLDEEFPEFQQFLSALQQGNRIKSRPK